jgi:DNA repair exonuclease SbcCD ATPase subunit
MMIIIETKEKRMAQRRSEAEKAQQEYDKVTGKVQRKRAQIERLNAEADKVSDELSELEATQQFWAGHPLVNTASSSTVEE